MGEVQEVVEQILGNLLYNVANLLNPGNTTLLLLLAELARL